jgi:hypothetical protein
VENGDRDEPRALGADPAAAPAAGAAPVIARRARALALALGVLALALYAAGTAFFVASVGFNTHRLYSLADVLVFAGVGGLVASRQPRNPIGWIFSGVAVVSGLSTLADGYATTWVHGDAVSVPLAQAAAWFEDSGWALGVLVPVTFLLLLFPDGRLLSPRWRPVAWCAGVGIAGAFVVGGLLPGPLEDYPTVQNPYGTDSVVVKVLLVPIIPAAVFGVLASPVSLVLRRRRATGVEREQIKWLAWAGAVAGVVVVVGSVGYDVWGEELANGAILLSVLALPVVTGIAILRYRLYDIDVVINRTLVYGALTATLAGAYLAGVLLFQLALGGLTRDSSPAVAASTLAVAALFGPARTRIQGWVDRRFYRSRYDAQRTLEAFGARLRDEVDLGTLDAQLTAVVGETLSPAHVSLWLREPDQ